MYVYIRMGERVTGACPRGGQSAPGFCPICSKASESFLCDGLHLVFVSGRFIQPDLEFLVAMQEGFLAKPCDGRQLLHS